MKVRLMKNIMEANSETALKNRKMLKQKHMRLLNVLASPGSGKTSIIMKLVIALKEMVPTAVIEGDIASSIDAEKFDTVGIPVMQINTGGGCHLDSNMISTCMEEMALPDKTLIFVENVGNLVCPAEFDLGESERLVILSVPEGHDKPFKYPSVFESADIIVLNKSDLFPYIDFDKELFYKGVRALNQKAPVFEVSCRTGEGLEQLIEHLKKEIFK